MSQDRQARYRCVSSNRHYALPHAVKSVRADQVEPEVWAQVERMVSHPALVFRELAQEQEQAGEQQERLDPEREGYQRQLAKIEREASKIWEAYTGEAIDLVRFKSLNAELEVKKLKITAELTTLDATVQALAHSALDLQGVYDFFAQWADRIDTIAPEQQAQMIKKLGIVAIWPPGNPLILRAQSILILSATHCATLLHTEEHLRPSAPPFPEEDFPWLLQLRRLSSRPRSRPIPTRKA